MAPTLKEIQECISNFKAFMKRVEEKAPDLSNQEAETSPHGTVFRLQYGGRVFLNHPEALDQLLEAAPQFEAYRGKGSQIIINGLPKILGGIIFDAQHSLHDLEKSESSYSEEQRQLTLKKIATFALPRAKGNGKPIRSHRTADLRNSYWDLLTEISENLPIPEALDLAKATARNEKASLPERSGAIDYLLTHQAQQADQKEPKTDPEIETILTALRDNPPSRDILFQILNAGVESGEISEMSALFDLEDWDETNEN